MPMAKFLRTTHISAELMEIVDGAKEKLYLISPYLKVNPLIKESIARKDREFFDWGERFDLKKIFGRSEKKAQKN